MPYTPVDINNIQMDTPSTNGYAPVDINNIKMDAPTQTQAPEDNSGFLNGVSRGAANRVLGAGQLLNDVGAGQKLGVPPNDILSEAVKQSNEEGKGTGFSGTAGEMLGDPLNYVPLGGPVAKGKMAISAMAKMGAKYGAASGLTAGTENPDNLTNRLENTGIGTATGAISAPLMGKAIQSVVSPNVSQDVQTLLNNKVPLTPGAIIGGFAKRIEDAATSIPVVGDIIKYGQKNSIQGLNNAAMNRALSPIGESIPSGVTGRDAVQYVSDKLDNAYQKSLSGLTANVDHNFINDLGNIKQVVSGLPEAQQKQFENLLNTQVMDKMGAGGDFNGEALKGIESELGKEATGYSASTSWDDRKLGQTLYSLRDSMRDLATRTSPSNAAALKAANSGYANFVRIRNAASKLGAKEGIFSPAQLQNAVRASDKTVGKGAFSKGKALMQDLSEPATNVLPSSVPDSGTPMRLLTDAGILGGAGAAAATAGLLPMAAKAATTGALYTPYGMKAAEYLLARRPDLAPYVASLGQNAASRLSGVQSGNDIQKASGGKIGFNLKKKSK